MSAHAPAAPPDRARRRRIAAAAVVVLCVVFGTANPAGAQPEVDSNVGMTPESPATGEEVAYTAVISVQGNPPVEIREGPDFGQFEVLQQSRRPSFEMRNGDPYRRLRLEYRLAAPDEAGTHTIGSPRLSVGDQTVSIDDVTVEVREQTDDHGDSVVPRVDRSDERAFVDVSIDPDRHPYVGEQLVVEHNLYIHERERRLRARPPGEPALDDFWVVDLPNDRRHRRQQEHRDGRFWYVTLLDRSALFALRSGTTTIDAVEVPLVNAAVFGDDTEQTVESEPVELQVQPLPEEAPDAFSSGNVGRFELSVDVDSRTARAGGELRLTATIEGDARPDLFGEPTVQFGDDLHLLAKRDDTEQTVRDDRLWGTRSVDYRLMPLRDGTVEVPPVTFSSFDPESGDYVTHRSDPIEIEVEPGDVPSGLRPGAVDRADDREGLAAELHGLVDPGEITAENSPVGSISLWVLMAIPLVGLVALAARRTFVGSLAARVANAWRRRRVLARVESILADSDTPAPARCLNALRMVFADQLGVLPATASPAELRDRLDAVGVPEELTGEAIGLFERLVAAHYGPGGAGEEGERLVQQTGELLRRLIRWRFRAHGPGGARRSVISPTAIIVVLVAVATAPAIIAAGGCEITEGDRDEPSASDGPLVADDERDWNEVAAHWVRRAATGDDPTYDYNAGTAYAHADDLVRARVHLERAAADGDDPRVDDNLAVIAGAVATPGSVSTMFLDRRPAMRLVSAALPWVVVGLLWTLFALVAIRQLRGCPRSKAVYTTTVVATVLVVGVAAACWFQLERLDEHIPTAVVGAEQPTVFAAPSKLADRKEVSLPRGGVVRIEERRNRFTRVTIPGGESGWVATDALKAVEP